MRKVGKDVNEAIFELPNCTTVFSGKLAKAKVQVQMERILDGVAAHMDQHPDARTFLPSDAAEASFEEIVAALEDSRAQVLINYLPVGSKVCFLRMEGKLFGGVPMNIELRLSVEDSPNSAGVTVDAIRCAKLALDRGVGGPLVSPSAFFMKHPPEQFSDDEAYSMTEEFISGSRKL